MYLLEGVGVKNLVCWTGLYIDVESIYFDIIHSYPPSRLRNTKQV